MSARRRSRYRAGDTSARDVAANDEIWRPGYAGPPPISVRTSSVGASSASEGAVGGRFGDGRRVVVSSIALVGVLVVGCVVFVVAQRTRVDLGASSLVAETAVDPSFGRSSTPGGSITVESRGEPLDPLSGADGPFPGADRRRLPTTAEPLWTLDLARQAADGAESATTWVEAVDDRFVVVGVGDGRRPQGPAVLRVLDATTGEELWSTSIETRLSNVAVVATVDDVLVLTAGDEVLGFDLADGSERWGGRLARPDGDVETIEWLEGSDVLAVTNPDPDAPIRLISATTGEEFRRVDGELVGSDRRGRWYERRGDEIFESDLRDQDDGARSSFAEPELVATIDSRRNRFVALVGGYLVTEVDARLAVGPLLEGGERAVGPTGITPVDPVLDTPRSLVTVQAVLPLGGSTFATLGGGVVTGAAVSDDGVRFAWQRSGAITADFATERGVVLVVGSDGGAAQTLVDGATGETIAPLTMSPGLFDALEVVGNGIVTRRSSSDGLQIAASDLDGDEMWALDGSTPVAVGDGFVVRSVPQPDGSYTVTAYGDPAT